ncbi:MAG: isoleucine--tRNA ligase [Alloprevotella sp.]|nr:isoleucine--tRNA ligase [Alloprevotella sp.]
MDMKFTEHGSLDLPKTNQEILERWEDENLFWRSIQERDGAPDYVFYDGPPSANGHPGIHHVMARTLKDLICRYKTMQGYRVERKAGWDTHGLPVELGVEKELGITKEDIGNTISVADYNAACRNGVLKYTREWEDLTRKMGYWADMEHPYITYDNSYIETLWWLLRQLYDKDLLYKGYTIQPYSPAAGTGLSSHELNLPGCYRDVKDTTLTAQFRILDPREEMKGWGEAYFLAWTTTPWTLPSNTALCVGPKIDYVAVRTYNPYNATPTTIVMARALLSSYFKPEAENQPLEAYDPQAKVLPWQVVGEWKGTELVGMHYEQLLPWVKPYGEDAFRVIPGDYVSTEDGTGIVHIAPTFGADDAFVAKKAGIPPLMMVTKAGKTAPMVDLQGRFFRFEDLDEAFVKDYIDVERYAPYAGRYVKNDYDETLTKDDETLDVTICMDLKHRGLAWSIAKHVHSYPHCWRTDKPVLYYPLDSWFIRSTAARERMIELNKTIKWKPESTGTGRFGKWLENLNDWNLSRSRFWGTPLPIWRNDEGEERCIGSIAELYDAIEESVKAGNMAANPLKEKGFVPGDYSKENYEKIDLHRPYVDDIILTSPTGRPMRREADLIDVWFDSGAMPYAQAHYPFENKEALESGRIFPADFIAEGVDQTRGWFYTLHAIGTMVFDSVAFKNVISNGLVLDKKGIKMSKRIGNVIDPFTAIDNYGSDPVRWYMMTNSQPWDNRKFDEEGVVETSRGFFGKLYQTYSFFAMYANVDGFSNPAADVAEADVPEIDRWMLSRLNSLVKAVTESLDDYEPTRAGRLIAQFVTDDLSNWYVRLNRKRFWAGEHTADKLSAYKTLYACLETVSRLMAPIAPFYADQLYRDLHAPVDGEQAGSVHLAAYPKANAALIDAELERRMDLAQKITSMVLSLRKKEKIKAMKPLQKISIPTTDVRQREDIEAVRSLILQEVNVKELEFAESGLLQKTVKCNFRVMGKKFGKRMKAVAAAVGAMTQEQIAQLESAESIVLMAEGEEAVVERADVDIVSLDLPGWSVMNEGNLTVALDITLTPELVREGTMREIVKRIQNFRKEAQFDITDHIKVQLEDVPAVHDAMEAFSTYISAQVLADELVLTTDLPADAIVLDIEGSSVKAVIKRN